MDSISIPYLFLKENLFSEGQYDHLTYSRRKVGSLQPHYYRVAGNLGRSGDPLPSEVSIAQQDSAPGPSDGASIQSDSSNELNTTPPEAVGPVDSPKVNNLDQLNVDLKDFKGEYTKLGDDPTWDNNSWMGPHRPRFCDHCS